MEPRTAAPVDRFWYYTEKGTADDCWTWRGALAGGYGRLRIGAGRKVSAHRFAYELMVGPIPADTELDHLCRETRCVRPDHLEPVTHRTNVLRGSGLAAEQIQRTHCPQGHELSGDNLLIEGRRRRCATCRQEQNRERSRRYCARKAMSKADAMGRLARAR